jgi:hypothetical protein
MFKMCVTISLPCIPALNNTYYKEYLQHSDDIELQIQRIIQYPLSSRVPISGPAMSRHFPDNGR